MQATPAITGVVTKTPGDPRPAAPPELEALEELGDDAIIAQQAAVHLPQPRAQVAIESRSIVIAEQGGGAEGVGESEPTRELAPYTVSSADPTVVIRDRKLISSLPGPKSTKRAKTSNVGKIFMWGGAGVIAFGVGGALALLTTRGPTEPAIDAALQHSAPLASTEATPALEPSFAAPSIEPSALLEPTLDAMSAPPVMDVSKVHVPKGAISATELPIEKAPPRPSAQAKVPRSAPVTSALPR
jgi:hypothetical protein